MAASLQASIPDDAFTCANCDAAAAGAYCAACGQKRARPGDLGVAHAWEHLADELLDVDGRIFRTLRVLFTQPGQLTVDFLAGRRLRYVHPLRLFLVISGLFFLFEAQAISPTRLVHSGPGAAARAALKAAAARGGDPYEVRLVRVDEQIHTVFKIAFIGTVVVNGLWFWILLRRSRRYLGEHMVTALHLSTVTMTVTTLAGWIARPLHAEAWIGGAITGGLTQIYVALALRRIYPGQRIACGIAIVTTVLIDYALLIGVSLVALRVLAGLSPI